MTDTDTTRECELCGESTDDLTLTADSHPEGPNLLACPKCDESNDNSPNQYAGTEDGTEDSVVKVTYRSLERGRLVRYLEPGETINLPADRVEVEVLDDD